MLHDMPTNWLLASTAFGLASFSIVVMIDTVGRLTG